MNERLRSHLAEELATIIPLFHRKFIHRIAYPIPPNPLLTLVALHDHGTQTITELSQRLLMSKQQMSLIVEKLLKSGYIERTRCLLDPPQHPHFDHGGRDHAVKRLPPGSTHYHA